jgi:hypothetical protein
LTVPHCGTVPTEELWRVAPNACQTDKGGRSQRFRSRGDRRHGDGLDRLLADFKLVDRDDALVTMLAKLVIEIVRTGERDPERIRQEVLGRRS